MRRLRHALVSVVLLATAAAGGPGLTFSEIWQHSQRLKPGHGHRDHFEARGGQDHDDRCEIGLVSAPARAPSAGSAELRLPEPQPKSLGARPVFSLARVISLLPLCRAPPAVL
jgi:hypothetical protein